MGDGTKENPYTRDDVLKLIEEHGGTAKGLDLSGKEFEEGINLRKLDLRGIILKEASLVHAHLEKAQLHNACLERTRLWCAHFEGAHLESAHLDGADLSVTHFERADLSSAHLKGAWLWDAHLEGANLEGTYLDGADLSVAHLEGVNLYGARFSPETKLGYVDWGNYILGGEKEGEKKGRRKYLWVTEEIYRRLKIWYTNAGMYDVAAKFYYREKEANRKGIKLCSKHWNDRLAAEFMRVLFGYGEEWKRILIWIAVVIFGLAGAYHFWGSFSSSSFWDTLYYSAVSFTALGYGKWAPQPTGWAKGVGVAEAIIGVFMMALLLVTFVRKWTR